MRAAIFYTTIFALLFSVGANALGQTDSLDDRIKSLTDNIAKLEATPVSPSMQATHRQNIQDQRIDLIALLGEKKGEIQNYLNAVTANLLPEQRQRLVQQIGDLDDAIALQKRVVKGNLAKTPPSQPAQDVGNETVVTSRGGTAPESESTRGAELVSSPAVTAAPAAAISLGTANILSATVPQTDTSPKCPAIGLSPASYSIREQQLCDLVEEVIVKKFGRLGLPAALPGAGLNLEGAETFIVNIVSKAKNVGDIEDTRTDKQTGSDAQAKGTTSLVVKGGTPAVMSWAVENGAATAITSGTTINFRFNPLGVIHALGDTGYFPSYDESEKDPFTKFLRKTSFGLSFDASRGEQPGVFTGNSQQISALSARYEFVSDRDPRNRKHRAKWDNLVDTRQIEYTNAAVRLRSALVVRDGAAAARFRDVALQTWLDETNQKLSVLTPAAAVDEATLRAQVEEVIRKQVDAFAFDKVGNDTKKQIISFVESLNSYLVARDELLEQIAKGKVMAFEYTNHREVNAPDTSTFNFIAEKGTVRKMDLTFNAGLTMYNTRPAGLNVKRIRDFVFAGQFDAPLSEISGVGAPVISVAGRYERATENAFALDGTLVPNTTGDVGSLQLKFLLPIKGTGIRLPLSVTFANRTQLIREREVRANFGFTFDLDRLFANNPFFKK